MWKSVFTPCIRIGFVLVLEKTMLSIKQYQAVLWPNGKPPVRILLEQHDYAQVAEQLLAAHKQAEKQNDLGLASYLSAVYQICLSCQQHQKDVTTYYDAYESAVQRDAQLQEQLTSLLAVLEEEETAVSHPHLLNGNSPAPQTFWKRVQNLFISDARRPVLNGDAEYGENRFAPSKEREPLSPPNSPPSTSLPTSQINEQPDSKHFPLTPAPTISSPIPQPNLPQTPTLAVYFLGTFQVFENDHPIEAWSNGKAKLLFKYLILHRQRPISKERLMDLFWPDSPSDAARNNLNVAIYNLRQLLRNGYPEFSHILFQDNCYLLNPEIEIWTDFEQFNRYVQAAQKFEQQNQQHQAIAEYHKATEIYQGDFLADDPYEEWLMAQRRQFGENYLALLDKLSDYYYANVNYATCIGICHKILTLESCREETHRQLMRSYVQQNQHHLALRQYHLCSSALKKELDLTPAPATTQLYEKIRHREPI